MTLEHGHVAGAQGVLLFEDGIAHQHDLEGAEEERSSGGHGAAPIMKSKSCRPVTYRKPSVNNYKENVFVM